jgi:hypothetical protein
MNVVGQAFQPDIGKKLGWERVRLESLDLLPFLSGEEYTA